MPPIERTVRVSPKQQGHKPYVFLFCPENGGIERAIVRIRDDISAGGKLNARISETIREAIEGAFNSAHPEDYTLTPDSTRIKFIEYSYVRLIHGAVFGYVKFVEYADMRDFTAEIVRASSQKGPTG